MQKETKIQGILMCLFYLGHLCLDLVTRGGYMMKYRLSPRAQAIFSRIGSVSLQYFPVLEPPEEAQYGPVLPLGAIRTHIARLRTLVWQLQVH